MLFFLQRKLDDHPALTGRIKWLERHDRCMGNSAAVNVRVLVVSGKSTRPCCRVKPRFLNVVFGRPESLTGVGARPCSPFPLITNADALS